MYKVTIKYFNVIVAFSLLVSCASVPVNIGESSDIFPDKVPSNICYLRTVRSIPIIGLRFGFNSTGTLIERQYLVTAAHNLYDSWFTKLISVQVSCKDSSGNTVTSIVGKNGINKTRKVGHYNRDYSTDYAFLKLNNPISVSESITLNRSVNINEIPTIKVAGYPDGKLKYGTGNVFQPIPNDSTFYYEIDTVKGMSGGPVWAAYKNVDSLVGVHVSEGRARLVDNKLIDDFENWKASLQ
ncbi:trypsin-like serine peptidase [Sessilibacter corallicola]|uniref:Serine protease n=1 Tax=Sessilibacter corallicola TaxID=2904075 RepID=A0ABQ0AF13_9GAMM